MHYRRHGDLAMPLNNKQLYERSKEGSTAFFEDDISFQGM